MEILELGGHAYSVYITNDYLVENGLCPARIDESFLLRVLPERIAAPVIELYGGSGGVMAFVRPSEARFYYAFPSFEALLEAVRYSSGGGELWLLRGCWVLAAERRGSLDDFGMRAAFSPEYAKCAIGEEAILRLRNIFLRNTL